MVDVVLVEASPAHVGTIANRMREVDQRECAGMGKTAKGALRSGLSNSDKCWTVKVDGRAEAMFGRVTESALSGRATIWFLGTDEVMRHARLLLLWGRPIVKSLGDSRLTLHNLVSTDNGKAIRLLRRWGFDVGSEVITVRGVPFVRFERTFG